jgi:hypothetical protein
VKDPGKQYLHWVCSALFDRWTEGCLTAS